MPANHSYATKPLGQPSVSILHQVKVHPRPDQLGVGSSFVQSPRLLTQQNQAASLLQNDRKKVTVNHHDSTALMPPSQVQTLKSDQQRNHHGAMQRSLERNNSVISRKDIIKKEYNKIMEQRLPNILSLMN